MSDYTKTTNFTAKDSLPSGDSNKKILGSLFDTEFDAIVTAVATKSNKVSSPTLNNLAKLTAAGDLAEATSIKDDGTDVSVATGRNLKLVDNGALYIAGTQVTSTAAELNLLDGVTTLWHSGNDGAGSGLDADTLDGVQGANFYRSDQADTAHSFTTASATGGNQGADTVNASGIYVDSLQVSEVLVHSSSGTTTGGTLDLSTVFSSNTQFDSFRVEFLAYSIASSNNAIEMRASINGSSLSTAASYYTDGLAYGNGGEPANWTQAAGDHWRINDIGYGGGGYDLYTSSSNPFIFHGRFTDVTNTTRYKYFHGTTSWNYGVSATPTAHASVSGHYHTTDDLTGIGFVSETGGNYSYTIKVYGCA